MNQCSIDFSRFVGKHPYQGEPARGMRSLRIFYHTHTYFKTVNSFLKTMTFGPLCCRDGLVRKYFRNTAGHEGRQIHQAFGQGQPPGTDKIFRVPPGAGFFLVLPQSLKVVKMLRRGETGNCRRGSTGGPGRGFHARQGRRAEIEPFVPSLFSPMHDLVIHAFK